MQDKNLILEGVLSPKKNKKKFVLFLVPNLFGEYLKTLPADILHFWLKPILAHILVICYDYVSLAVSKEL